VRIEAAIKTVWERICQNLLWKQDHVTRAEHISLFDVLHHQGQSTRDSQRDSSLPLLSKRSDREEHSTAEQFPQWLKNILFTGKKIFTIEEQYKCQNRKIYAQSSHEVKENVPRVQTGRHPSYVTVWWGVVTSGGTPLHFCEKLIKTVPCVYQQDVLQAAITPLNTLRTGDANLCFLHFCITIVKDR
jgi:hypothetical protein